MVVVIQIAELCASMTPSSAPNILSIREPPETLLIMLCPLTSLNVEYMALPRPPLPALAGVRGGEVIGGSMISASADVLNPTELELLPR